MDLLPSSSEEFSSKSYWDTFFKNIKDEPFEWYGEYDELSELLHKYISLKDNVLITGCGNSTLSFCLHRAGISNQISIDISDVVVAQMKTSYPDLNFMLEDVTQMSFQAETFTCVLDKGTVDALTPPTESKGDSPEEKSKVEKMFDEVNRVTKNGGRFIIISLLQPHVAEKLFNYFYNARWMIRVVRCSAVEEKALKSSGDRIVFPVFMIVVTKVKLPPTIQPVIEVACGGSNFLRLKSVESLLSIILNQQSMMQLRRELMNIGAGAEKEIALRLVSKEGEDRYVFYVTDAMKLSKNPVEKRFGVFIVPEGRETEWLFGTHEGRIQLAQESNFTRLIVVHFVRGQTYESMESVQKEISGHIQFMMPRSVSERNIRAPIMTISNDVGTRTIRYSGKSEFSGDFVVEDVVCDSGQVSRRLIFLNNPNVIQSDVALAVVKKKGKERTVFKRVLACEHHQIMSIAFGLLSKLYKYEREIHTLLVGLGGGLLAFFLVDVLPKIKLTAVEIDSEIVKIAHEYFGLPKELEGLEVVVEDGLKVIESTEKLYNIILLDVDNKSVTEGLSCPPPAFLEEKTLLQMKARLKPEAGILVLNLVCRNAKLKDSYVNLVKKLFPLVYSYQVGSDLNNILFCFASVPPGTEKQRSGEIKGAIRWLDSVVGSRVESGKKPGKSQSVNGNHSEWNSDVKQFFDEEVDFIQERFQVLKVK